MVGGTRRSYGIICCRPSPNGLQMLMIKKATTYHFCEFVAGHYNKKKTPHLKGLFNNMTYHEKMDILTLKFQNMWYRIYRVNADESYNRTSNNAWTKAYVSKKNKFERDFLSDGGVKLRLLISQSANVDTPWEFPKGRASPKEKEIDTAIREFREETGINETHYNILWHLPPYVETYNDFGTTYINTYYYATAVNMWEPIYRFSDNQQISEVSAVQWVTKQDLKHMKLQKITFDRLVNSFTKIIRKYKNAQIGTHIALNICKKYNDEIK